MLTTLLLAFVQVATASEPLSVSATPTRVTVAAAPAHRWVILRDAGRFDELAVLSRDAVLNERLSELRRARFMQERMHAHYQPEHPQRVAIDDRVRELEHEVTTAVDDLIRRAGLRDWPETT